MRTISESEYNAILARIEELLTVSENIANPESKGFEELNRLSDLVADFEEKHYPINLLTKSEGIGFGKSEY